MVRQRRHTFELVLVLLVFCIYAAGSLFLCALGASTYKDITASMQENYDLRTGVLYLAEKTRQNDVAGGIRVDQYEGVDALVLTEQETGRGYETWIFVHDNMLCEQLIAAGTASDLSPALLQPIMPMKSMTLGLDSSGLLSISLVTPDETLSSIALDIVSSKDTLSGSPRASEGTRPTSSLPGGA